MIECYWGDLSGDWKQSNVGVKGGSLRNFYQHHCFHLVILSKEEAGTLTYPLPFMRVSCWDICMSGSERDRGMLVLSDLNLLEAEQQKF